jgi:U3 small nucleolar RNA-associated protein 18
MNIELGDGEVYVWDMKSKRCIHKFKDEGCIKATALAVSPNGLYIACGYVFCQHFPI